VYFLSDFIVSYYIIGNHLKNKGGLFCDVGLGYQLDKNNSTRQYYGNPSFDIAYKSSGLGLNLSLGGSYKVGNGRVYFEFMLGGLILGKYEDIASYPINYPLPKDYPNQSSKVSGGELFFVNDGFIAFNLGYCFL